MVINITPLRLVDIPAIASLTVLAPLLSLLKSKNAGMLILLGFASFMASLELFVVIMLLSISLQGPLLSVKLVEFVRRRPALMKVIKWALLNV
jgi:hypothetical protein